MIGNSEASKGCQYCGKGLWDETSNYCDDLCQAKEKSGDTSVMFGPLEDDSWVNGVWENISWEPIKITGGRRELIEICKKHNCAPKSLLKPKSQGKGWEIREKR